jgi:protocatechuate 3,4-dioxygenase beta subunit
MTGKSGLIEFATIYPGWYQGRTIHIHMKVHLAGQAEETYNGGHVSHTGQLFFPEDITERIAKLEPYVSNARVHRTLHAEDEVFTGQHGAEGMMTLDRLVRNGNDTAGFLATATIAVDPDALPAPVGPGGPGGRGRGRGPNG